jgi:hypothetical protein
LCKSYYYFVNVNYPFVAESEAEAYELVEMAKIYNQGAESIFTKAKFNFVSHPPGYELCLYQFGKSIPASDAKEIDFNPSVSKVESDEIFPVAKSDFFPSIDLELTPVSVATEVATKVVTDVTTELAEATKAFTESVYEIITDFREGGDKSELISAVRNQTSIHLQHVSMQFSPGQLLFPPMKFNELTTNSMLVDVLSTKAECLGYTVTTNKSGSGTVAKASKYYNSRPDLAIYQEDCAYVVIKAAPASDETSEESTDDETTTPNTLIGGVTGNIGQLLAGMDKVAGDLAYQQLRNGGLSPERRVFQQVKIYGLIIDLEDRKSKPYVLNMDFIMKSSVLFCGRQELDLATSINRLLSCLECK